MRTGTTDRIIVNALYDSGVLSPEVLVSIWPEFADIVMPSEVRTVVVQTKISGSTTQGTGPLSFTETNTDQRIMGGKNRPSNSKGRGHYWFPIYDSKTGGDPIVMFSGQFFHEVTDLQVKGRGLDFAFTRTYLNQTFYKGPLGYNWDHNYNLWLREEREVMDDGSVRNVVYRSNGHLREDRYIQLVNTPVGDLPNLGEFTEAVFQPPIGFCERLEKSNGRYVLEDVNGVRFEYNEDLFIERIIDVNGNEMFFEYADHLLKKIRDPIGKEYVFEYDEMNKISTLTDITGERRISYHYGDNGDLEEVDVILAPDFIVGTDYRYSDIYEHFELQHNLLEIINPLGHSVLLNEYGTVPGTIEFNRVVRQRSDDGEYLYEYGPVTDSPVDPNLDPINIPTKFTRIHYPNNHYVDNWFNDQGNIVRSSEKVPLSVSPGNVEEVVTAYNYNEDGMVVRESHSDGSAIEYLYQREVFAQLHDGDSSNATPAERLAFKNLLRKVERPRTGLGETRAIVTRYTYTTTRNRLESQVGPFYADPFLLSPLPDQQPIYEVHYDHDEKGNLLSIIHPEVLLPDGSLQNPEVTNFTHNTHGLITDMRVGALHTQYIYFDDLLHSGFLKEKVEDADGKRITTTYEVDELGRVTGVSNHHGDILHLEWTKFDKPLTIQNFSLSSELDIPTITTYNYNLNRQITRIEEEVKLADGTLHPDGSLVHSFSYDQYQRLVEHSIGPRTKPKLQTRTIFYNSYGLIEREIDFRGHITFTKYDDRLNLSAVTNAWGKKEERTRLFVYNPAGELNKVIDGRKFETTIERDAFGRQKIVRDAEENEFVTDYDAASKVIRQQVFGRDPNTGLRTRWKENEFRYDALGRPHMKIDHLFAPGSPGPDELITSQYFFDALNRLHIFKDPAGAEVSYEYDNLGRLTTVRDAEGNETNTSYDDIGLTISVINREVGADESGAQIAQFFGQRTEYSRSGLLTRFIDEMGNVQQFEYDSRGLLIQYIDQKGMEYKMDYDIYGRPVANFMHVGDQEIRAEASYDNNGNLSQVTSPIGGITNFEYDAINRPVLIKWDDKVVVYGYDNEDNLIFTQDENGIIINRAFTATGMLQKEEYNLQGFSPPSGDPMYTPASTSNCEFLYTPLGKIAAIQSETSHVVMNYDSLGRTIQEINNGLAVSYRYNALGLMTGITYPNGRDITYNYSNIGALSSIHQNNMGGNFPGTPSTDSSKTLARIWRVGIRPLLIRFEESHQVKFSYDLNRRVVGADWTGILDGVSLFQERNLYGSGGELRIQQSTDYTRTFSYDDQNRLIQTEDYHDIDILNVANLAPPEDDEDIPTEAQQQAVDSLIESLDSQLNGTPPHRSFSFQLDNNANRLETHQRLSPDEDISIISYTPDNQDRYQIIDGHSTVYDKAGNLLSDGVNRFRYDAKNRLAEINNMEASVLLSYDSIGRMIGYTSSAESKEFVYGGLHIIEWRTGGNIEGQTVPLELPNQYASLSTEGTDFIPLFDAIGSIVAWVNSSNSQIVSRCTYGPFGQVLERSPIWPSEFGFAGYTSDKISGIYLLPARGYHPHLGRFLQRDPLGFVDGMNLYAYAHHSPGGQTDYWGFFSSNAGWVSSTEEATTTVKKADYYLTGIEFNEPVTDSDTIGEPSLLESIIPVWGSLRSSIHHAQKGEWGWAAFHGAMAISDVFLVKSVVTGGARLLAKGAGLGLSKLSGRKVAAKEAIYTPGRTIDEIISGAINTGDEALFGAGSVGAARVAVSQPRKVNLLTNPTTLPNNLSFRPALFGTNRRAFRREVEAFLRANPSHELSFLLNSSGRLKRTWGLRHSALINDPTLVQMGHVTSRSSGAAEHIVLQNAWLNQFDNITVETARKGGYIVRQVVNIGGISVEARTARIWLEEGLIPSHYVSMIP